MFGLSVNEAHKQRKNKVKSFHARWGLGVRSTPSLRTQTPQIIITILKDVLERHHHHRNHQQWQGGLVLVFGEALLGWVAVGQTRLNAHQSHHRHHSQYHRHHHQHHHHHSFGIISQ